MLLFPTASRKRHEFLPPPPIPLPLPWRAPFSTTHTCGHRVPPSGSFSSIHGSFPIQSNPIQSNPITQCTESKKTGNMHPTGLVVVLASSSWDASTLGNQKPIDFLQLQLTMTPTTWGCSSDSSFLVCRASVREAEKDGEDLRRSGNNTRGTRQHATGHNQLRG